MLKINKDAATDKYQLNAFIALLMGLVGFIVCVIIGAFLRAVLPKNEIYDKVALAVGVSLTMSFFGFMKSKISITQRSERSLRTITILVGVGIVFAAIILFVNDYFYSK